MSHLQIGDRVLSLNSKGNLEYSEVMIFMHRSPQLKSKFLRLTMTSGINITITPSHLILRWQKPNTTLLHEAVPVYAQNIQIKDQLLIHGHTKEKQLYVDTVIKIETVYETGVYAPLTVTGTIIVNDVVASCYAVMNSQRLAHLSFAPIRIYNRLGASLKNIYVLVIKSFVTVSQNSTVTSRYIPPSGVHWYCKFLQGISYIFLPNSWMIE